MLIPFFATLQQISPSTTETLTQPSRSSGQNGLPISRDLSPLVARFKLSNPANKIPREKQSNHTLPAISSASVLPTRQIYLFGPRVKTPLLVRTYPGFDNKSSAIDPRPQVDVNWYAYNGETIAERDRATVALQKRPFDPVGRAHGWGKIGVKMVISWLYCCIELLIYWILYWITVGSFAFRFCQTNWKWSGEERRGWEVIGSRIKEEETYYGWFDPA